MPVNTAALKTFAPAMRRQLIEAVGRKLDLLLHQASADTLTTAAGPIEELRQQEATNRQELLERVAYSWFNRLAAVRYLDARGWHPFGARVLMPQTESETQPELLKLLRSGSLPAELQPHTDEARLQGLLDGRIPTAQAGADPQGEVYRELILAVCRSYHQLLPNLFEGLDDASELLLPDDLLSDGSIAGGFRSQISDGDCEDVEIIGWLYQFYISEKKEQVIGKVVKSEDIPAATQLFTPNWIVKYMVQNSLGAQWLATYPASALKGQMEYYIEPAEQTDEVKAQLAAITPEALNPEELTLIDPACGSGHILVEAYDLFKAIYLERGYPQREIPQLILEKNLFGLDIDERAAQLTSFALMMKGRGDDRRLFERGIQLNVMALVNSDGLDVEGLANAVNLADHGLKLADLVELKQLFEHATTFGSLIQVPDGLAQKLPALRRLSELKGQDMLVAEALKTLEPLVRQAELLAARYGAMVANPPYMGNNGMCSLLKNFTNSRYPEAKSDLLACFIERGYTLATAVGHTSMVTIQSWMFLSSFQKLRERILREKTIASMMQIGYNSFPTMNSKIAQATAFSLLNRRIDNFVACFVNLNDAPQSADKQSVFLSHDPAHHFKLPIDDLKKLPGSPIAYWASKSQRKAFEYNSPLSENADLVCGMTTGDNNKFVRQWCEVSQAKFGHSRAWSTEGERSQFKWFPYNKGGEFRKWYGNNSEVVNWEMDGRDIIASGRASPRARDKYFRPAATWSFISSSCFGVRYSDSKAIFDMAGCSAFSTVLDIKIVTALLCSNTAHSFLKLLNPTLAFQVGNVGSLPVPAFNSTTEKSVSTIARKAISVARSDWDNFETSWDFLDLPILRPGLKGQALESSWRNWVEYCTTAIRRMQELETENNRLFIAAYGLEGELQPEVPEGSAPRSGVTQEVL